MVAATTQFYSYSNLSPGCDYLVTVAAVNGYVQNDGVGQKDSQTFNTLTIKDITPSPLLDLRIGVIVKPNKPERVFLKVEGVVFGSFFACSG